MSYSIQLNPRNSVPFDQTGGLAIGRTSSNKPTKAIETTLKKIILKSILPIWGVSVLVAFAILWKLGVAERFQLE